MTSLAAPQPMVLDTNIVLDVWVFQDHAAQPLRQALEAAPHRRWLATSAMREELARVLTYTHIQPRLATVSLGAAGILDCFDRHADVVTEPARAALRCADPDDQKFIDLAVAYQALLLSKDRAVLSLKKRLLAYGVIACDAIKLIPG